VVEVELQYDASTPVSHADTVDGIVPTSATVTLYGTNGTAISAPAVTLPTVSTSTAAGTTAAALVLVSVAGLTVGSHLVVTSDGVRYVVEIARLDGTTVYLAAALPLVVDLGSAVKALKMTATVTAPGSAHIGAGLRLVWVFSSATESRTVSYAASVVRWQWHSPVSAEDVREIVVTSYGDKRSQGYCQKVAERVNAKLKAKILQTGRRPWLFLSAQSFSEAADKGIRYVLAEDGICQSGQIYEAQRETRFAFDDALAAALLATPYDANQDGQLNPAEIKPLGWSIQATR